MPSQHAQFLNVEVNGASAIKASRYTNSHAYSDGVDVGPPFYGFRHTCLENGDETGWFS